MAIKHELQAVISAFFDVDISRITLWRKLNGCNYIYSFYVNSEKYVIRKFKPPHPNTVTAERAAYAALKSLGVTDEVLYLDDTGTKITRYIEGVHLGYGEQDQEDSINLLRNVHERAPAIQYSYDIFGSINYWASLCWKPNSQNLKALCEYQSEIDAIKIKLDSMNITPVLCHGDPCVNGNMLRQENGSIRIIDWEYSGMADPFMDLALASVHQGFENMDPFKTLERYLRRKPTQDETYRLKAYITLGTLELAAWQINELSVEEFQEWLTPSFEPFGLFGLSKFDT